jgi:hypothetical protein
MPIRTKPGSGSACASSRCVGQSTNAWRTTLAAKAAPFRWPLHQRKAAKTKKSGIEERIEERLPARFEVRDAVKMCSALSPRIDDSKRKNPNIGRSLQDCSGEDPGSRRIAVPPDHHEVQRGAGRCMHRTPRILAARD